MKKNFFEKISQFFVNNNLISLNSSIQNPPPEPSNTSDNDLSVDDNAFIDDVTKIAAYQNVKDF